MHATLRGLKRIACFKLFGLFLMIVADLGNAICAALP